MIDDVTAAQRVDATLIPAVISNRGGEHSLGNQRLRLARALGDVHGGTGAGVDDGLPAINDALVARPGVAVGRAIDIVPEPASLRRPLVARLDPALQLEAVFGIKYTSARYSIIKP